MKNGESNNVVEEEIQESDDERNVDDVERISNASFDDSRIVLRYSIAYYFIEVLSSSKQE